MVSTTVPTFLFSLITIARRATLFEAFLTVPSLIFCTYGYYSWTVVPAKLHEEIYKSKSLLCMNEKIWESEDREVMAIARTLAIHLDQPDLGISLWGFTMVSKPLILTTLSVLLTFWAFLIEFNKRPSDRDKDCST
ncbi:unnamed protein product, partial [Mesorhabditis belari]|uniref:Uncharacterized protein n=1 Tax=Mesorhabditis belari TaxID=2138241 RepID=A0AAF3J2D0_9BILA